MDASLKALIAQRLKSRGRTEAFTFGEVLEHELLEIQLMRERRGVPSAADAAPLDSGVGPAEDLDERTERLAVARALRSDLVGLAFSGGGIRSATFNLGVLQALADLDLLDRFDYLSTVSGGGYIGSWFTALVHRERLALEKTAAEATRSANEEGDEGKSLVGRAVEQVSGVFRALTKTESTRPPDADTGAAAPALALRERPIERVQRRLRTRPESARRKGRDRRRQGRAEDPAITFLRRFSNYLTPKVGFLSADTWAVATTYVRNLLLNLAILVSALSLVLLVPRVIGIAARAVGGEAPLAILGAAFALATLAVVVIGYNMAFFDQQVVRKGRFRSQESVQLLVVLPLLAASAAATSFLARELQEVDWLEWGLMTAAAYFLAWCVAGLSAVVLLPEHRGGAGWSRLILWAAPAGFVGGQGLMLLNQALAPPTAPWQALAWGPPLMLAGFALLGVVHIGFMGGGFADDQREWMSRLGAWLLIYAAAWAAVWVVVVYGPVALRLTQGSLRMVLALAWVAATLGGLLAGRGGGRGAKVRSFAARVAPYVFIVGLVALLALGVDRVLAALDPGPPAKPWEDFMASSGEEAPEPQITPWGPLLWIADLGQEVAGTAPRFTRLTKLHVKALEAERAANVWKLGFLLTAILVFLSWRIDVNEFSMHRFYRNRLVRCYLGASVEPRLRRGSRQPFTGFHDDDIDLAELGPDDLGPPDQVHAGPLPIVNAALNLVGGGDLALQERKAASFVFTPLYSGFDARAVDDDPAADRELAGYRPTSSYGADPKPVTLGGAVAISGAAASPNMGFRSTPALALLLTVFNLRLGWWLGNPAHATAWSRSGPPFSALHLLREVLGLTSAVSGYVNLSDGGHFENLGIYELVRRRCRFIIASDAAGDPDLAFQDLGNTIRKCRTDLGVEIEMRPEFVRRSEDGRFSRWHCGVGRIRYDRQNPDQGEGTLLYLKASLTGDEPEDVLNYAAEHPDFPHQATADQWFTESQFESYRVLGHHVTLQAIERAVEAARPQGAGRSSGRLNVESLFVALRQQWHPPNRAVRSSFTRHGGTLDAIFDRARSDGLLKFLDAQFYPEWESLMSDEPRALQMLPLPKRLSERRQGFYFCNSLIQLMENVYHDFELETAYDHPDSRGWMNLFKHWSWAGMFRATWAISSATYGSRFQVFCEQRLGLSAGRVHARSMDLSGYDDAVSLNFFEKALIGGFVERNPDLDGLERLEVAVGADDDGVKGALLRFTCGFALTSDDRIFFFRIQDHLRKMGLGRLALRSLMAKGCRELANSRPALPEDERGKVPSDYYEFDRRAWKRFRRLHDSVRRERDGES